MPSRHFCPFLRSHFRYTKSFSGFVTSAAAPVASGWSTSSNGPFTRWNTTTLSRRTPVAVIRQIGKLPFNVAIRRQPGI